jgi:hypothetical protein
MNTAAETTTRAPSLGLSSAEPLRDAAGDSYAEYRSLSGGAVVSVVLGVLSVVALLPDFWALKVIPLLGIVAGSTALVRIRRRPDEFSGRKLALVGTATSLVMFLIGTGWGAYEMAYEVPEGYQPIDYSLLKHPDPRLEALPSPAAQSLEGKKVFLRGYMFPPDHDTGIAAFLLCRDNGDCCFGGQPPPSDMVFIKLENPLQTSYSRRLRRVAGTFHVAGSRYGDIKKDVLYQLDADYIK